MNKEYSEHVIKLTSAQYGGYQLECSCGWKSEIFNDPFLNKRDATVAANTHLELYMNREMNNID